MWRLRSFSLVVLAWCCLVEVLHAQPGKVIEGWGDIVDPSNDCKFYSDGSKVQIAIPGTAHDLSAELKQTNAPRIMQDVDGDFTVTVKVADTLRPTDKSVTPGRTPFNSAGILIWQDESNYVRVESAALVRDGKTNHYALFEWRRDGRPIGGLANDWQGLDLKPTQFRFTRKSGFVQAAYTQDGGTTWWVTRPSPIPLPNSLKVGVAAINTADQPMTAEFENFAISRLGKAK